MEMVSITEGMTMSNISFDSVSNSAPANALQGVGTNALVDNPFTFEPVAEQRPHTPCRVWAPTPSSTTRSASRAETSPDPDCFDSLICR